MTESENKHKQSEYTNKSIELINEMLRIIQEKGQLYGDSWRHEGLDGLIFDIKRKYRRLLKEVMQDGRTPQRNETLDLAVYTIFVQVLAEVDGKGAFDKMSVRGTKNVFES